jgi:MFS family permease
MQMNSGQSLNHNLETLQAPPPRSSVLRARAASMVGTMAEAYDFALYGAAAGIVFPRLFFGALPPATGALLAFIILLGGYVVRPLGGIIFGHFGDRYGRRKVLFITLILMGTSTFAMGLLPPTEQVGIVAPIILVVLRLLQGLAYGGEWAGATLMSMEHSPKHQHGLGASIAAAGGPAGSLMAAFILGLVALLPEEQFLTWGWRAPFLISMLVVMFGLWLRSGVDESPEFVAQKEKLQGTSGAPLIHVLKLYPKQVLGGVLVGTGALFIQGLLAAFMIPYLVGQGAVDRSTAFMLFSLSSLLQIFTLPFFAAMSDRYGRKTWLVAANAASVLLVWPVFALFESANVALIGLAFLLGNAVIISATFGPFGAYISEKFEVQSRYTGVSLSFQIAAMLGAGAAPVVAQTLVGGQGPIFPVVIIISGLFVVAGVITALSAASEDGKRGNLQPSTEAQAPTTQAR